MNMDRAIAVLGLNARREFCRPMVRALGLHPWLNTDADHERRTAARYAGVSIYARKWSGP